MPVRQLLTSRPRLGPVAAMLAAGLVLAGCSTGTADPGSSTGSTSSSTSSSSTPAESPSTTTPAEPSMTASPSNGPNTITAPQDGAVVQGPDVTVSGEGTAFEGTLLYLVGRSGTDETVAEGYTMAGANGEVGPWQIALTLEPGEYDIVVWEPGMGEGDADGEPLNLVGISFTVE